MEVNMRRIVLLVLFIFVMTTLAVAQDPKGETKKEAKTDAEQSLLKLDRDLLDAMLRKDRSIADRVEVANHVFINPNGGLEVRGEGTFKGPVIDSVDSSDATVKVHGDTALLTGKAMVKGRFPDGPDISGSYRYMRVFVKQGGDWRLIATTVTPIGKMQPAATSPKN